MGDTFNEGDASERPVHTVYVSAFYMATNLVSKALWDDVAQWATSHGYSFNPNVPVWAKGASYPVYPAGNDIIWCNARSEKEGLMPCYYIDASQITVYRSYYVALDNSCVKWTANGYRLPTEAEWEKAARGGLSGKRFPWEDFITHTNANYYSSSTYAYDVSSTRGYNPACMSGGFPYSSPVGSFSPNGYGLCDMAGNVQEYLWDWFDPTYYSWSPAVDPRGPDSAVYRSVRGGSWVHNAQEALCADRVFRMAPTISVVGFRCARGL
jgi:formylglycine-generating enzyme